MKNLKNKLITGALVVVSFTITAMPVNAAGGPYPYNGHTPEDTAFGGDLLSAMAVFGVMTYVLGTAFIILSKSLKNKLSA